MEHNIAVCVICYNRKDCLERVLKSLDCAEYTEDVTLIISIDKSKTRAVQDYAEKYKWNHGEKIIKTHPKNLGLRKHVLSCGEYTKYYDAVVILEDDITVSPFFMNYVIQCYDKYKDDERIAGFSLYNFPRAHVTGLPFKPVPSDYDIYMMNGACSWGQVWTKEKWEPFIKWYERHSEEFDIKELPYNINNWGEKSWLKYHMRYCIEENKYFTFPYFSLSTNGADIGTHGSKVTTHIQSYLYCLPKKNWRLPTFEECVIKYDGFFEPKFLAAYLSVPDDQLCIDFYGNKKNRINRRYRLTREALPHKIIKQFALSYKPYEANIICKVDGNDIFLYDTEKPGIAPQPLSKQLYFEYFFLNCLELLSDGDLRNIYIQRLRQKFINGIKKIKKIIRV